MPKAMPTAQYATEATQEVANFIAATVNQFDGSAGSGAILDSVRTGSGSGAGTPSPSTTKIPSALDILLGRMPNEKAEQAVLDSVYQGMALYEAAHGTLPTADLVEAAIQQGNSALLKLDMRGNVLDSATSTQHDQMSLQPNRAVVAVVSGIAEGIPFAGFLPVDIGSNEGILAILTHEAGTAFGDFALNEIMDGVKSGGVYGSSSRLVRFDVTGAAPYDSKFTTTNLTADRGYCNPAGTGVPVLRGRTILYVNGRVVGTDSASGSAANSPITASFKIGATDYTVTGYVTVANGATQLTTIAPALPAGTEVVAEAFINYEASPALIPSVGVRASTYKIHANPSRVMTRTGIDSAGQMRNELGIDAQSQALLAARTQSSLARHYKALRLAYNLGANHVVDYDFDYAARSAQMNRSQMMKDFEAVLSNADQKMANDTMDHGITHLYAPAWFISICESLGLDMFVPSGVTKRPSIYRAGRLFGKYEVYYSPEVVSQSADLSEATLVGIGRSTQVARCPIILGDAVSSTFLPLGMQQDLMDQAALYSRDFTVVNPHDPSALGCVRIKIRNLG